MIAYIEFAWNTETIPVIPHNWFYYHSKGISVLCRWLVLREQLELGSLLPLGDVVAYSREREKEK